MTSPVLIIKIIWKNTDSVLIRRVAPITDQALRPDLMGRETDSLRKALHGPAEA